MVLVHFWLENNEYRPSFGNDFLHGRRVSEVDFLLESLFFSASIDILFDQVWRSSEYCEEILFSQA